jgi:S-layer protein (TIGR01567 family)
MEERTMKKFETVYMATLILLVVFVPSACALGSVSDEIHSKAYNGTDIYKIFENYSTEKWGTYKIIRMDANSFPGFFYDIDNNISIENLGIIAVPGISGRDIGAYGLKYTTTIGEISYKYKPWGNYTVLGFLGDECIPLKSNDASKFVKLVIDTNDEYTLKSGEKLDLGSGYSLLVKQTFVDDNKVWLELDKGEQYVDDAFISTKVGDQTWTCQLDKIQGEDDVNVFKVHVNKIEQGAVDSIVQIDGLWLIDYAKAIKISTSDKFGVLNDVFINGSTITIFNDDAFNLTRGSDIDLGNELYLRVADSDALRFYAFKKKTDPRIYEIRGTVDSGTQPYTWNSNNFAGFFYDLNKDVGTEAMDVSGISGRVIPMNGLVYTTTIGEISYKYKPWGNYTVLGFLGDECVPLKSNDASKFVKLVIDTNDEYTLKSGEKLDLGSGYSLLVKQIDIDGNKVWLELDKDEQYVDYEVISTKVGNQTWTCQLDKIQGEDDVNVFKVHVNKIEQGAVDSIVQIDGLWLIDYAKAIKISTRDEFGVLNNVSINGPTICIHNRDPIILRRGTDMEICQGMYFKVANSDQLRYYPYVERNINVSKSFPDPIPIILLPIADFSSNVTSGYAPLYVKFKNLSKNTLDLSWDFDGDGVSEVQTCLSGFLVAVNATNQNIADSNPDNPVYVYNVPGFYNTTLTAINKNDSNSKTETITVFPNPEKEIPVANFTSNVTGGFAPFSVKFTDLSKNVTS